MLSRQAGPGLIGMLVRRRFRVCVRESMNPAIHIKMLLDYHPPCLAHTGPAFGVIQQICHGVGYGSNLARGNKHATNAITNHFADTANIRGYHGPSTSRCLD
jgi:hypothetical protein